MITQDSIRKLRDEAGNGNIAVWANETMTLDPSKFPQNWAGRRTP
jgi:hypothetical protein